RHGGRKRHRHLFDSCRLLHRGKGLRRCGAARPARASATATAWGGRLTMRTAVFPLLAVLFSAGCAVGPNYRRPQIATPSSFRAPEPLPSQDAASVADQKWFEIFKDAELQNLVRRAFERNYDLRDAVARVAEARAALGITRSDQYPNF